ncbi:MAG TPA: uracil-DNA glycosylase [Stellaceae bacterium]|nr:uracil-DNA glycosylase [Stellaceae bacterium]
MASAPVGATEPSRDCPFCPRLAEFRDQARRLNPDWHNAPVPSFGNPAARLLIVGLAPGLRGANRTGRPFTGDYAGDLLYACLLRHGLAEGEYQARPDDGMTLPRARLTNAARCVPPENKPLPAELKSCRPFLKAEIDQARNLRAILALGQIAHTQVLAALGERQAAFPFRHGAQYTLKNGLVLADSYHCSRYNTNTGRLTADMFDTVIRNVAALLA